MRCDHQFSWRSKARKRAVRVKVGGEGRAVGQNLKKEARGGEGGVVGSIGEIHKIGEDGGG